MKKFIILLISFITVFGLVFSCGSNSNKNKFDSSREAFIADSIARVKFEEEKLEKEKLAREKEIADSLEKVNHNNAIKNSIVLTSYYLGSANSCGGRDIGFRFKNINKEKTVKYLDFTVTFYNAVGDYAYDEIRDYRSFNGRITGPVKPNGTNYDSWFFECAIYNYQAKKMVLNSISIEYTDGTTLDIYEWELPLVRGYKG